MKNFLPQNNLVSLKSGNLKKCYLDFITKTLNNFKYLVFVIIITHGQNHIENLKKRRKLLSNNKNCK